MCSVVKPSTHSCLVRPNRGRAQADLVVGEDGEVWGGVGKCGEVWGDVGRCGEM